MRKFFIHLTLIFFLVFASYSLLLQNQFVKHAQPIFLANPTPSGKILLIPLDSRPPCTDYVKKLASMAGYEVIQPPNELLDKYRTPANIQEIRHWLEQNIVRADSAIISVDMLLHGGLWNSRQQQETIDELQIVLELLLRIQRNHPQIRLYAFSIIPRLFLAQDLSDNVLRERIAEWSVLQEKLLLFENPIDWQQNLLIESKIPSLLRDKYRELYKNNRTRTFALINLVQQKVLSGLVIGQDDSTIFGLGNIERNRVEEFLRFQPQYTGKIFVTRGTDEVALNMLNMAMGPQPETKAFVFYTEKQTPELILPYMPRPLAQTVKEKLTIVNARQVDAPDAADFILVVNAGISSFFSTERKNAAQQIKSWLAHGKKVAVVDLAMNWQQSQTLLPYLKANDAPLQSLLAYAGWNTASNSVGTAVTQSVMVLRGKKPTQSSDAFQRELNRIRFLAERILDDWHYQKSYQHHINTSLRKQKIDPYDLSTQTLPVQQIIHQELLNTLPRLIIRPWQDKVFSAGSNPPIPFILSDWQILSDLPWDRTFEIKLDLIPTPAVINIIRYGEKEKSR